VILITVNYCLVIKFKKDSC